jgi:alpha-D-ribose 1-methylphosphonate 5-triphosphate synthase subunit PhnI
VEAGERELRRMRRAGFDAGRPALAAAVAAVDGALATVTFELDAHREALARLAAAEPLDARLARDRAVFSEAFAALYLGAGPAGPWREGAP